MLLKAEGLYVFGPYRLDVRERQLLRDGETVSLPPKAFDVSVALVSRAGHLVTKEELLAEVWAGTFVEDANISYTISLVRRALGEEVDPIETVPKVGYRFTIPVSLVNGVAAAIPSAATSHSRPWRVSRTVIAVVVLLLLLGAGAWIVLTSRIARNSVPEPLTRESENVVPSWSRDEKWIYFGSNRTGRFEVWKVPSAGGFPTQVTHDGGFAPLESDDGKFIYYVKGLDVRGIWRIPLQGGDETQILDGPKAGFWGHWALLPHGIVFATQEQNGRAHAHVKYFNFSNKQETPLGDLDTPAFRWNPHFAVSSDEKWIYYVKRKQADTSDIMLVKNFR